MSAWPKISVCIPTYNRACFLRHALASVLVQERADFEVVVSDNASTDNTSEVVRALADPRVRYYRNARNLGPIGNGRRCQELAVGEYLTFLFDDDVMMAGNLARKTALLDQHPSVGMVHSRGVFIDEQGAILSRPWLAPYTEDRIWPVGGFFRDLINSNNLVMFSSVVFRRECIEKLGFVDDRLGYTNDFELWMRIALHYEVAYLDDPLVQYRVHGGQDSWNFARKLQGVRERLEAKRLVLEKHQELIADYKEIKSRAVNQNAREALGLGVHTLHCGSWRQAAECYGYALKLRPLLALRRDRLRLLAMLLLGRAGTRLVVRLSHLVKKEVQTRSVAGGRS